MKYAKMMLILTTMLLAAQPTQALSWESFKWENLKKNALAATAIVGLSFTAAYQGFKIMRALNPLSEPQITSGVVAFNTRNSQPFPKINPYGLKQDSLFQNLADTFGIDISVNYLHLNVQNVVYKSIHANNHAVEIEFNPYSRALNSRYKITENTTNETKRSILNAIKQAESTLE